MTYCPGTVSGVVCLYFLIWR